MNLQELKEKLNDRLMIESIYTAIWNNASVGNKSLDFLHTEKVPNKRNSRINDLQINRLREDGYHVVHTGTVGSYKTYTVSGW